MIETELLFRLADAAEDAGEYQAALAMFTQCATLGDVSAWERLGYMHDVGRGTPVDKAEAMRCYRRAWRYRSAAAANNIAILYRERGDHRATFRWFQRAAEVQGGSPYVDLARCYLSGAGVRRDVDAALRCLSKAMSSDYMSDDDREQAQALLDKFRPAPVSKP